MVYFLFHYNGRCLEAHMRRQYLFPSLWDVCLAFVLGNIKCNYKPVISGLCMED